MYRLKEQSVHRKLAWGKRFALDFVPDERLVSKMEHEQIYTHNGIKIGNLQLKKKEIFL